MSHGRTLKYVARRLLLVVPQMFGVLLVTFILVRMLPGNPAELILGPQRTEQSVRQLEAEMGLDESVFVQFLHYSANVVQGDFGRSFFTGAEVADDVGDRFAATLELLFFSLLVAMLVGVSMGVVCAHKGNRGWFVRGTNVYTRLAGAFPDFWIALIAVYFLFFKLALFPAPLGRLGTEFSPPDKVTGLYTVDSLLSGDFVVFWDALSHLALPVLVLGLVVAPILARITNSAMTGVLRSDHIRYARACGLPRRTLSRYVVRNALPPVLTVLGILFVFLLGGAVLIEKVFAWGGLGEYAVQSVENTDYAALQGFVLVASAFTMIVYLIVDLLHMAVDPRVRP